MRGISLLTEKLLALQDKLWSLHLVYATNERRRTESLLLFANWNFTLILINFKKIISGSLFSGTTLHHIERYNMASYWAVQHCIILSGTTLHHIERYNMASYWAVQHGVILSGTTWRHVERYNMASYWAVQHGIILSGTTWHHIERYNMASYWAVQHCVTHIVTCC
jgi:predicted NAD-dependent protein-ADP-ribosyltransferase YbiA (DUF1768 family)